MARTLLIAESDSLLREVYAEQARRSGYAVLEARDVEEAWSLFEQAAPDALIVDAELAGEGGGPALMKRFRSSALGRVLPAVLLSPGTRDLRSASDALLRFDTDEFMEKPIVGDALFWRVGELIEGRDVGATLGSSAVTHDGPAASGGRDLQRLSIAEEDAAELFFFFARERRTGRLVATRGSEVLQVDFRRGLPVAADSSLPALELGAWLVERRELSPQALADVRPEWRAHGRDLGTLLVARGRLGARVLMEEKRRRADAVIAQFFAWTDGEVFLDIDEAPGPLASGGGLSLHRRAADYVVEGIQAHYPASRCRSLLLRAGGALERSPSAHFIVRELADSYRFENLLSSLRPGEPVEQLLSRRPFEDGSEALQLLAALWVVGAVLPVRVDDVEGQLVVAAGPAAL